MSQTFTLPRQTDTLFTVDSLINNQNGLPVTDAVIEVTLLTKEGVPVSGQTWPLTLSYSSGKYQGVLSRDLQVQSSGRYNLKVEILSTGAGLGRTETLNVFVS